MKALRVAGRAALLAGCLLVVASPSLAQSTAPRVIGLSLEGVVDPFTASYVRGGIEDANSSGASAIVLTIDTPGGLSSSMRDIVQAILESRIPVVCFVGPSGARAASAGTFILMACPVAAMAPGTNVGAAHPVGVSGAIESEKATNDAAAYIRSLAEQRGRNADWAERAVRESVSASAEEALRMDVIDLVQPDRASVLGAIDGREVTVASGARVTLDTAGARVTDASMGLGPRLLHAILTPDLAFLFFYVGLVLLIVETLHPGISVPGILGVLSLIAAVSSFGLLPVTAIGVILLLVSAAAFVVEATVSHGVAGTIGVITLILSGLFLFDTSVPNARVSIALIVVVGALLALFFFLAVPAVLRARRRPVEVGAEALVGGTGVALTKLNPSGSVRARGETWSAQSMAGSIDRGTRVRVTGMRGVRLEVEPAAEDEPPEPSAPAVQRRNG